MSVFGNIMSAIFGHGSAQAAGTSPTLAPGAPSGTPTVDVAAVVDKAAAANGEKLAWRTSIVDLMKALNLDSSLAARKELAKELNYTGDTNDSATMNVWLHKQVMTKLAANGGKLPADSRPEVRKPEEGSRTSCLMSAFWGQKQTCAAHPRMPAKCHPRTKFKP